MALTTAPSQTRLRPLAGHPERRQVRHPQRALQGRDEPRQLPGDQEQVLSQEVQGTRKTPTPAKSCYWLSINAIAAIACNLHYIIMYYYYTLHYGAEYVLRIIMQQRTPCSITKYSFMKVDYFEAFQEKMCLSSFLLLLFPL